MLALARYDVYLLLHIVLAVVWLGGGLALSILGTRIATARDPIRMVAFARDVEWMSNRIYLPASAGVLIFGFLMIHAGFPAFDQFWIQLALGLFGVTFLTGLLFLGPQVGKIGTLIEQYGEESTQVQAQIRRVLLVSRLDLLTLYSILVLMVAKPETDNALLFTIWAIVLAVAAALVVVGYRRGSSAPEHGAPLAE